MSKAPVKKPAKAPVKSGKPITKPAAKPSEKPARADIIGDRDEKAPAPASNFGSDERAERAFAARFREIYSDMQECKDDLKELRVEARAAGLKPRIIERAAKAAELSEGEIAARDEEAAHVSRLARLLGGEWMDNRKKRD